MEKCMAFPNYSKRNNPNSTCSPTFVSAQFQVPCALNIFFSQHGVVLEEIKAGVKERDGQLSNTPIGLEPALLYPLRER